MHPKPEQDRRNFVHTVEVLLASAVAKRERRGVREIGVRADAERANEYLQHAATFFGDKDARFELAKHYLSRGGEDVKRGMHYLSVLSEEAFPSAQAFLADLFWRGKYVKKDEQRALALITMAVENAPEHERIWIEDIYQNVFCGSSLGTRKQADGIVATWRKIFARPASNGEQGGPALQPQRTCGNGEVVDLRGMYRYERAPSSARVHQPPVAGRPCAIGKDCALPKEARDSKRGQNQ